MKLSILTATYNRSELLERLYKSIVENLIDELDIEWLIMDDGSSDNTEEKVKSFASVENLEVKYYKQENQGKMSAINNLMNYVTGELIIDCDSDDFFIEDAFTNIYSKSHILFSEDDLYGIVFLKKENAGRISGNLFKTEGIKTTMFDMYFKDDIQGEKVIVFKSEVRKKYRHEIVDDEKFVTEARMYHKMDENYGVKCFNVAITEGQYLESGYTSNIISIFKKYPKGHFEYFKEILNKDMKNVRFKKRVYALKHLILFKVLCGYKHVKLQNKMNQFLYYILLAPGTIITKMRLKD